MDEDKIDNTVYDATSDEFPETPREKKPFPEHVPSVNDTESWDPDKSGFVKHTVSREELELRRQTILQLMNQHNKVTMKGQDIVCQSCPFEHTLSFEFAVTMDKMGKIVLLDNDN